MKLSCVIPSYKDPYLWKTIDSLLTNSELPPDQLEVIAVLDGYWPNDIPCTDKRLRIIHLGKNRGMREAINAGVALARGEFILRTDEHCMFGPGYDRILTERFKDNWIVYPMRYYLNPETWTVMDKEPNLYNKLVIDKTHNKFSGLNWKSRAIGREHKVIDESMAMQGSCWIMKKSWWEKVIVRLQTEGYGPLYQDSHEMVFKTWQAGGKLMVHKGTWHAHKDRSFSRTHNYGHKEAEPGWKYSIDVWGEYYEKVIRPRWKI
jgi:glycosyltransferase involved in cell wall biosynthesis